MATDHSGFDAVNFEDFNIHEYFVFVTRVCIILNLSHLL